jgi:hypothetical protein
MPSAEQAFPIPLPTKGLRKDIPPTAVGFSGLIDAENWIYRDARFFVRPGLTDFADDIDERPMGFHQYNHGDENDRLVMGTDDSWWHYNAGTDTWANLNDTVGDDNPLSGGPTAQVVFKTFESGGVVKLIGVNGADPPKLWDGSGYYEDLAGSPPSAAVSIAVAADRVLMAKGDSFYWSGNLDEEDWTASGVRVADTPGDIVALMEFGNMRTAIYKENSIYMAYAQVDLLYKFRIELVRSGLPGPVSPNAVFPIGELGLHCYLAESGAVMLFDGNVPVSMGDHIQTHIRQTRDYDLRSRSFGFYDPLQNDIYVFYASSGASDVNTCVIINYDTRVMHYYTFPDRAISAGFAAVLTDSMLVEELPVIDTIDITFLEMERGQTGVIFGEVGGQVYHHFGHTDDGDDISAYFETGLQFLDEPRRFGLLHQAEHLFIRATGAQEIKVNFGKSDYGEAREFEGEQDFDIGDSGPYETSHHLPGRLYALRMSATADVGVEWLGSSASLSPTGLR